MREAEIAVTLFLCPVAECCFIRIDEIDLVPDDLFSNLLKGRRCEHVVMIHERYIFTMRTVNPHLGRY